MTQLRHLILLTAVAALVSCGHRFPERQRLAEVDSMADTDPQAAMSVLDTLSVLRDSPSEAALNYAALIRIKARDKAYITHRSDTAILRLVSYYEEDGDRQLLPVAYYYAGRVYSDKNDAPQALDYFQKAEQAAKAAGADTHLLSCIYSQEAYILDCRGFYRQTLEKLKQAYSITIQNADTLNMIYNLRDMGRAYSNLEMLDSSAFYYKQACFMAYKARNAEMLTNVKRQLGTFYLYNGRTEEAEKLLMQTAGDVDSVDISSILSIYSDLYIRTGKVDSAVICYKKLLKYGNIYGKQGAYEGLTKYYLSTGQNSNAQESLDSLMHFTDSIKDLNAAEQIAKSLSMYNYTLWEKENTALKIKNQHGRAVSVVVSMACFALFILVLMLYSKYRHRADVMRLKDEKLNLLTNEIEKQRQSIHPREVKPKQVMSTEIYRTLMLRIKNWDEQQRTLSTEEWDELDRMVNHIYENFRQNVDNICPVSEFEYHVCLLIKLKVSPVNIARMTNHSKESITSTRRRLFEKAFNKKCVPAEWDDIILSL